MDAESRYNETMRRHPKIRELNCNAHPRRKLRDAEKVQPVLAAEAGGFQRHHARVFGCTPVDRANASLVCPERRHRSTKPRHSCLLRFAAIATSELSVVGG